MPRNSKSQWNSSATPLADRSSDGRISTVDVLIASDPNSTTAAGLIVNAENRIPRRWVYLKTYLTYLNIIQYYFFIQVTATSYLENTPAMPSNVSFTGPAGAAAKVSIIDSGFRLSGLSTDMLLTPSIDDFDRLPGVGSWSFLVESSTGRKILFDLGGPADIALFPPQVADAVKQADAKVEATKTVADILVENGIELTQIDSVILR